MGSHNRRIFKQTKSLSATGDASGRMYVAVIYNGHLVIETMEEPRWRNFIDNLEDEINVGGYVMQFIGESSPTRQTVIDYFRSVDDSRNASLA